MKLTVYGRAGCPFCENAKSLGAELQAKGHFSEFVYQDYLELGWGKEQLTQIAGYPIETVPVVMINGVYIGGYTDLKRRYELN